MTRIDAITGLGRPGSGGSAANPGDYPPAPRSALPSATTKATLSTETGGSYGECRIISLTIGVSTVQPAESGSGRRDLYSIGFIPAPTYGMKTQVHSIDPNLVQAAYECPAGAPNSCQEIYSGALSACRATYGWAPSHVYSEADRVRIAKRDACDNAASANRDLCRRCKP